MTATTFPRFRVLHVGKGAGVGIGMVDLEDKACLMNICRMYLGVRDTNSDTLSMAKVT